MTMRPNSKPGTRRTILARELKDRYRQGESKAGNKPVSKSSQKKKPEPRGIKEKTRAALERRIEDMGGSPKRQQGNHQMHVPGSQNRKKGCSL